MKPKHIYKSNFGSDIAFISILMYNLSNLLMYQHVHKYYNRLHNSLCTMHTVPLPDIRRHKTETANVENVIINFFVKLLRHKNSASSSHFSTSNNFTRFFRTNSSCSKSGFHTSTIWIGIL